MREWRHPDICWFVARSTRVRKHPEEALPGFAVRSHAVYREHHVSGVARESLLQHGNPNDVRWWRYHGWHLYLLHFVLRHRSSVQKSDRFEYDYVLTFVVWILRESQRSH